MADPATKKVLQELLNTEELQNKFCVDCGAPRPQWASISFAVFICLQCAGVHRGFGVHISFVRSVSMDTWQDEQLKRMKLGGNAPFKDFLQSYPADLQGGYTETMSIHDKYHSWAATQYREKITATMENKPWEPSAAPPASDTPSDTPSRATSAQATRKSRASGRTSNLRQSSSSPAPQSTPASMPADQKTANESYFASLGQSNASRPDNLPPSQGGRYTGFGSTPDNGPLAAPGGSEGQNETVRALARGWSIFAGAVAAVSETVVERVQDAELRAQVGGYVNAASQKAALAAGSANAWGKATLGVDVGESVGTVVDKVKGVAGVGGPGGGYEKVAQEQWGWNEEDEGTSAVYGGAADDDFFKEGWRDMETSGSGSKSTGSGTLPANVEGKKGDEWDEWKDF
ncbi:ArfGap-domain-containing protein [Hysterangium stoloniferum]|nr:ArfGap-domain-containing protein [Hysterangium stoloniferum]